jgi:hypothetical protein
MRPPQLMVFPNNPNRPAPRDNRVHLSQPIRPRRSLPPDILRAPILLHRRRAGLDLSRYLRYSLRPYQSSRSPVLAIEAEMGARDFHHMRHRRDDRASRRRRASRRAIQ